MLLPEVVPSQKITAPRLVEPLPCDPCSPAVAKRSALAWIAVVLLCAVGSFVVQSPYRSATFVLDVVYYNIAIGLIRVGRLPWIAFLADIPGGYLHIGWKLQYDAMLRLLGLDVSNWHFAITATHLLTALLVYRLALRYLGNTWAAAAGAIAWASAAIGNYDSPLICIGSAEQTMALVWVLLAMQFTCGIGGSRDRSCALGMMLCSIAAAFVWGLALLLLPAILFQLLVLERAWSRFPARLRIWISCWAGAFLLPAAMQAYVICFGPGGHDQPGTVKTMLTTVIAPLGATLAHLGGTLPITDTRHPLAQAAAALAVIGLAVLLPNKRWTLFALMAVVPYSLTLAVVRSGREVFDGRYFYLPTFFWCLILATLVAGVMQIRPRRTRLVVPALLICALPAFFYHQLAIARSAAADFQQFFGDVSGTMSEYEQVLRGLSQQGTRLHRSIIVPDLPLAVPSAEIPVVYPISAFMAVHFPAGLPHLEVRTLDEIEPLQLAVSREQLWGMQIPAAARWAKTIERTADDLRCLAWLSKFALAHQEPIVLPAFDFNDSELGLRLPIAQVAAIGFEYSLDGLRIVPDDQFTTADREATLRKLRSSHEPEARRWKTILENLPTPRY